MGAADSKLKYTECVKQLKEKDLSNEDDAFWSVFWTIPKSVEDVYVSLKPQDVKILKKKAPKNLYILLTKVIEKIRTGVSKGYEPTEFDQILNCIRLLTRLMPFIMEDQSDNFLESVFWRNQAPSTNNFEPSNSPAPAQPAPTPTEPTEQKENTTEQNATETAPAAEDTTTTTGDVAPSTPTPSVEETSEKQPEKQESQSTDAKNTVLPGEGSTDPLGIRLLNAVINLLFYPSFTVERKTPEKGESTVTSLPLDLVWAPGVGVTEVLPPPSKYADSHRNEILRLLLVMFSETLYHTPDAMNSARSNRWLDIFACSESFLSQAFFYSLVNTFCTYDPIGWGLPYNYYVFNDYKESLSDTSLQVLDILLNYAPPKVTKNGKDVEDRKNIFVKYLADVQSPEEFTVLFTGMEKLLSNPLMATNTYLPNSTKRVGCHQEVVMLLFMLVRENKKFLQWVLTKSDVTKLVEPVLYYLLYARKDPTQLGLVHFGTFLFFLLSGEREFGVHLNKPFIRSIKIDLPTFTGTYADLMILVFYKLISDGQPELESLYDIFFATLMNIAPYIKSMAMVTTSRLMALFKSMSRQKFLFANEKNYRFVVSLLEMFNYCIQYQYEGNFNLIYAVIRNQKAFAALANIQLPEKDVQKKDKGKEKVDDDATSDSPKDVQISSDVVPGTGVRSKPVLPTELDVSVEPNILQTPTPTFEATEEMLKQWKEHLQAPLTTILRLLELIIPSIPEVVTGSSSDESHIVDFLKKTTMVGLLPVPPRILVRKYQSNPTNASWFTTFLWGAVYLRNQMPPLFYATNVKLFIVKVLDPALADLHAVDSKQDQQPTS